MSLTSLSHLFFSLFDSRDALQDAFVFFGGKECLVGLPLGPAVRLFGARVPRSGGQRFRSMLTSQTPK